MTHSAIRNGTDVFGKDEDMSSSRIMANRKAADAIRDLIRAARVLVEAEQEIIATRSSGKHCAETTESVKGNTDGGD